jgi:Flp pilus assembly CpaE family ATPase
MVVGVANALKAAELIDRLEELEPRDVQRLVGLNCAAQPRRIRTELNQAA